MGIADSTTGFLVHMVANRSIIKQIEPLIDSSKTTIMGIFPEDVNGFLVTGILSDKKSTVFIARVSFELYIISARTWNGKEPIEKMFLNGLPDRSISIATETNQYLVIYGFSPTLNLIWSVELKPGNA